MSKDNRNIQNNRKSEVGEDETKYGEFISSYFGWIPIPKQKYIADKLEKITKDKNG